MNIATSLTSGIQDIAALLPLLGTEQCEDMVSSAMTGGYLYVAATSVSLFGSLGIARAAFKVLVANITFKSKFIGAKKLHSAGFKPPQNTVLSMILLDERRYLAEAKLESMFKDLHIDDASKVDVTPHRRRWNTMMYLTCIIAAIGLVPYIHLIRHGRLTLHIYLSWGYPAIRILGSVVTATTIQIVLQSRVVEIVRQRLSFMVLDREVRRKTDLVKKLEQRNIIWDAQKSSEECFWSLDEYLSRREPERNEVNDPEKGVALDDHSDSLDDLRDLVRRHTPVFKRQCVPLIFTSVVLVLGIMLAIIGYIGCFSVVQSSGTKLAPAIWLVLETLLSLLRISIWAWDPEFDELDTSLQFRLTLEVTPPLVTCNKYFDELRNERVLPLVRDDAFLSEITSYTGLLPRVDDDRASLYYALVGDEETRKRVLYIIVFDYKEGTCRAFVKEPRKSDHLFYGASLKFTESDGTVQAELQRQATGALSNPVTEDVFFVEKLERHYDSILSLLNRPSVLPPNPKLPSVSPPSPLSNAASGTKYSKFQSNWQLLPKAEGDPSHRESLITPRDACYLDTGKLEWQKRCFAEERGEWRETYMALVRTETLQGITADAAEDLIKIDMEEAERVLMEEREEAETMLVEETALLEKVILAKHEETVKTFVVTTVSRTGVIDPLANGDEDDREKGARVMTEFSRIEKNRMKGVKARLENESSRLKLRLERERDFDQRRMEEFGREHAQVKRVYEEGRRVMESTLLKKWQDIMEVDTTTVSDKVKSTVSDNRTVSDMVDNRTVSDMVDKSTVSDMADNETVSDVVDKGTVSDMVDNGTTSDMVVRKMEEGENDMHSRLEKMKKQLEERLHRLNVSGTLFPIAIARREAMEYRLVYEREKMKARLEELLKLLSSSGADATRTMTTAQASGEHYRPVGSLLRHAASSEKIRRAIAGLEVGVHTTKFVNIRAQWDQLEKELGPSNSESDVSDRCMMIATALSRNPVVTVIDFDGAPFAIMRNIARSLQNSQSLTTIVGFDEDLETLQRTNAKLMSVDETISHRRASLDEQLQDCQSVTFYEDVIVTDHYRGGYPYLLFGQCGASKCIVVFRLSKQEALSLKLNHCRTSALGEIDITVNEKSIPYEHTTLNRDNFAKETVPISPEFLREGLNELVIVLTPTSEGVYWLSDISIDGLNVS